MRAALLLPFLLLGGCMEDRGEFPSLAKRPYEVDVGKHAPAPVTAPPPAPLSPADAARLAGIVERAEQGHAGFATLAGKVSRQVAGAAGSPVGSEAWTAAQVEVSRLEAARGAEVAALADLDTLFAERLRAGEQAGLAEMNAARARIQQQVEADRQQVEALAERLGG